MRKLKRSECTILPLVLGGGWFDMIASGKKREECLDDSAYWEKRIINWRNKRGLHVLEFRRGCAKDAPQMWFVAGDVLYRRRVHSYTWSKPKSAHYAIALGERVELEGGK